LTGRTARWTLALTQRWRSGQPYTITAPESPDGLFNTRPLHARRNGSTGPAQWDLGARLAWAVEFGRNARAAGAAVAGLDAQQGASAGTPGEGPAGPRVRREMVATIQNVANQQRPLVLGGVLGSPLFGRPLATAAPRSTDIGVRLTF
jgi:hypothetical protein